MYDELHVFAVIVEQSSMNKASSLLNLSQPALSRKIAKLEDEIGSPLFRRIGKRLELTPIGQLTYDYALELRQLQRKYLMSVAEYTESGRMTLTFGASLTTLQTTLPDLIQSLNNAHPEIDIKAVTGKTHEIVSLVRDHKIDIGVIASSINDSSLHCVPLFKDPLLLVLPKGHFIADRSIISIEDLNEMPMILFTKGTWYRSVTDELLEKYDLHPDVRMEIDSFEAIIRLLHTCRSATLLPKSYMRQQLVEDNDLVIIPIRELEMTTRTTSLIYADSPNISPALNRWIKDIAARFTDLP